LEDLKRFLSELNNQSLDIPKSKIIGVVKNVKDNSWVINIKLGLFGSTRVIMKREIAGDSIVFRSRDGDLVFRFNLYKLNDETTLVEHYIKALERMSIIFGPEIPLLSQRFIESIRANYGNIEVKQITSETYLELLETISKSRIRETAKDHEKPALEGEAVATGVAVAAEEKTPKETIVSKVIEMMPIIGSRERETLIKKPVEKSLSIECDKCLLYDETTGFCTLLMKKIEDPTKPLCNGESFIKRS
jgi:hypothetical protein